MFTQFLADLRQAGVPASLREHLVLLDALKAGLANFNVEDFYHLSRACLVKDERHFDRFDRVFAKTFAGFAPTAGLEPADIPEDWLKKLAERFLTPEERAKLQAMGWEKLLETLKQRLEEQKGRHQGGSKWIGTAGTSPFGAYGEHIEGVRIGQHESRHRRAVKVWDKREFQNLDGDAALNSRSIKLALRRLRRFARTGAPTELDLSGTIRSTAAKGGLLDIQMRPERRNAVKVLLLLDIGGSMDDHIRASAELFSAVRAEFKHLETFYFHNCLYERVWRDNRRRLETTIPTWRLLHGYGPDWRVVIVGDATMSPYEILNPGGSVEHWNEESGKVWMERLLQTFPHAVWLNPKPEAFWIYGDSLSLLRSMMSDRMFPLTLRGLDKAMAALSK
jgi:uncharacterized protein with von Willebrand factor type A (vWA) domain